MATRLYPNTKDPRKLEQLANVPTGTFEQLQELENREPKTDDPVAEGAWYDELFRKPFLNTLHHFLVFGWGRMAEYRDCCGESTDPDDVAHLLEAQGVVGVTFDMTEGLHWS